MRKTNADSVDDDLTAVQLRKSLTTTGSGSGSGLELGLGREATVASLAQALSTYTQHYEELRLLGRGSFGSVLLVRHKLDNTQQAIKRLHFSSQIPPWESTVSADGRVFASSSNTTSARILREVSSLSSLSHRRIVKYRNCWIGTCRVNEENKIHQNYRTIGLSL